MVSKSKFIIIDNPDQLSRVNEIRETLKTIRDKSESAQSPQEHLLAAKQRQTLMDNFIKLIISNLDLETVLNNVVEYIMSVTEADRGFLILLDEKGQLFSQVIRTKKKLDQRRSTLFKNFSHTITEKVLKTQQAICLNNVQSDPRFTSSDSIVSLDIRSVICVPLKKDKDIIGLIYIDRQSMVNAFSSDDLTLVQSLAEYASMALANARLHSGVQKKLETSIRNINERKKTEKQLREVTAELERSNKELEQFAIVISHDLKQPLRKIEEFAQLLISKYKYHLDSQADEFINQIVDAVNRLRGLMSELYDFSLVGRKEILREPTDLNSVIKSLLFDLDMLIKETGAEITFDHLPTIQANSHQLRQLFQNLINNAIKFRSSQTPKINITAQLQDDHVWLFSVSDNGIGLDSKYTKKIFQIFQRLHTKDRYPGSGIGLAVCKKIVQSYGGNIWVESETGQGSTFYFTIPVKEVKEM